MLMEPDEVDLYFQKLVRFKAQMAAEPSQQFTNLLRHSATFSSEVSFWAELPLKLPQLFNPLDAETPAPKIQPRTFVDRLRHKESR